ncbi:MAG: patatin-like phospholipase family protein [Haloarculaceae archaeon]
MTTNIAIACQGGGSHTAFTGGVLETVLPYIDTREDCRLVGLSGTSGGAVSALAGWYGYLVGGGERAAETLRDLWADIATKDPYERLLNDWAVWGTQLQNGPLPTPMVSPYDLPFSDMGKREFVRILERHVDFDALDDLATPECPRLVVGTVDVNAGEFETFTEANVSAKAILASAAVPTLFEAVEIGGHYHWDGLFSQNPPVYDLMHTDPARKPDELWIVQINPQTREDEPTRIEEIADRRNELSGNISLNQELRFIETVNEWIDRGDLDADAYSHTEIRRLVLDDKLSYASKLDRSPQFIERLRTDGITDAEQFLANLDLTDHQHGGRNHSAHE